MNRILLIVICLLWPTQPSLAMNITECNAKVPAGETGELQNDLYCDDAAYAVDLLDDATLHFNGHSVTGNFRPWPHNERLPGVVIECHGDCTIEGPGEIYGAVGPGLLPDFGDRATGIRFGTGNKRVHVIVHDLTIRDCGDAMLGDNTIKGRRRAQVTLTDVTFLDNAGVGIAFLDTLDAENVTADHNLIGLTARVLRGTNLHASNNTYAGIGADRIFVAGLIVQGNTSVGVSGKLVTLTAAIVTGNTWFGAPHDIAAVARPILANYTCTRSHRVRSSSLSKTWKVCSDD